MMQIKNCIFLVHSAPPGEIHFSYYIAGHFKEICYWRK